MRWSPEVERAVADGWLVHTEGGWERHQDGRVIGRCTVPAAWAAGIADVLLDDKGRALSRVLRSAHHRGVLTPPADTLFRALQVPPQDVRVVLVTSAPHSGRPGAPDPHDADGLAFSCAHRTPPTLSSLLTVLRRDVGVVTAGPGADLSPWLDRGVLLLHAALSTELGVPAAHSSALWYRVTRRIVRHALEADGEPRFVASFGIEAASVVLGAVGGIDPSRYEHVRGSHPGPVTAGRGFLRGAWFSRANAFLGEDRCVDWSLG